MKVLVVSNMYPSKSFQSYGIFVKRFCDELTELAIDYEKSVMHKSNHKIGKITRYLLFYAKTMLMVLLKNYDVIYIHYASHSSLPVYIASKFRKICIYTNLHGSDVVSENLKQEKMQKNTERILKISQKVIVPSTYFKDLVEKKYSIDEEKIFVYPSGGVNEKLFYPINEKEQSEAKKKYGLEEKVKYFGYCGRITNKKGLTTFIKAIEILAKNEPDLRFVIAGSGPADRELEELITRLNLNQYIVRLPLLPQEQLKDLYNCWEAFIFPTEGESLGLVGLEAMACGIPVIASDCTAPHFYVIDGINGYKFPVGDHERLAAIITEYNQSNAKERLSESAHQYVRKYLTCNVRSELQSIFKH